MFELTTSISQSIINKSINLLKEKSIREDQQHEQLSCWKQWFILCFSAKKWVCDQVYVDCLIDKNILSDLIMAQKENEFHTLIYRIPLTGEACKQPPPFACHCTAVTPGRIICRVPPDRAQLSRAGGPLQPAQHNWQAGRTTNTLPQSTAGVRNIGYGDYKYGWCHLS